jgi:hypothetical protein
MRRHAIPTGVVLVALVLVSAAAASAQHRLSGCVFDDRGAPIPGVAIEIRPNADGTPDSGRLVPVPDAERKAVATDPADALAQPRVRHAVADAKGCYAVTDLTSGLYTVQAGTVGLAMRYVRTLKIVGNTWLDIPVGANLVETVPGDPDSGIVIDVVPNGPPSRSLAEWWTRSGAVVRLRIEASLGAKPWSRVVSTEFQAVAIEVLKSDQTGGPRLPRFTFLQTFAGSWTDERGRVWSSGMPPDIPYSVGSDLIAFLDWRAPVERFARTLVLSVRGGRVYCDDERMKGIIVDGTPVEAILATLRAMRK